jgi:hypothetical protein
LVNEDTFWNIFSSKNIYEKSLPKIYLGQYPDPDVFEKSEPDPVKNRPDPQHCFPPRFSLSLFFKGIFYIFLIEFFLKEKLLRYWKYEERLIITGKFNQSLPKSQ